LQLVGEKQMAKDETKNTDQSVEATATATAEPTAPAGGQVQQDPMALSIGDLKGLASIIDVASTRGAFKAAELAGVGTLYNKLNTFLTNVQNQAPQQVGTDGAAQAPASTEGK
tara:strand:+ start:184 stop:522 length:339 start_codon:yes stop_codon:yes gene_type:complete